MTDGGRWEPVHLPDGTWRQDWVPVDQPGSPDGKPGEWHVVQDSAGHRWEWFARVGLPLPPAPPPTPVRLSTEPDFESGPGRQQPPPSDAWTRSPGNGWGPPPGWQPPNQGWAQQRPPDFGQRYADFEQRKRALAQAVQREVMGGARVESQTDEAAVLVTGKPINHILHLILSFLTCFAWVLVWGVLYGVSRERRIMLTVDPYGNVLRQST